AYYLPIEQSLQTINKVHPPFRTEAILGIHINDIVDKYDETISLYDDAKTKTYENLGYQITTYKNYTETSVPVEQRKTTLLRIGTMFSNQVVKVNDIKKEFITQPPQINVINPATIENIMGTYYIYFKENAFTDVRILPVVAGIGKTSYRNVEMKFEHYGYRNMYHYAGWYFDFLYSPFVHVSKLKVGRSDTYNTIYNDTIYSNLLSYFEGEYDITEKKENNNEGYLKKQNFGFRMGFFWYSDGILNMKFEFGAYPGLKKKNFIILFNIGFAIPNTVKSFKPNE
ncbi:MAG: hypothetical protein N2449_00485, partial [Bacteroidales bacterium]|nr:hypothetical protein [Bacteroidales bacterium]